MLKFAVVGLKRASGFVPALQMQPDVDLFAGCDTDPKVLQEFGDRLGLRERYSNYEQLLDAKPDAALVTTPMPFHAIQCAAALRRGIHAFSEVPAVVDLNQAWELVAAQRASGAVYMMGENYCYMKPNGIVREIARQGLFGEIYYGEGEYLHELKQLNEITTWRRIWQTGINGVTYGTHSLGPLLQWFQGDRVAVVSGFGSGHHYRDPRGKEYENEESALMLCKLASGGLVRVRVDMLSNRPHLMTYYQLQGTKGCYEANRTGGGDQIWLADRCRDANEWRPLSEFAEEFLPENWRKWGAEAEKAGHGGGDFLQVMDFLTAIRERKAPPIDLYAALDYSLPGLVSQESILRGGAPLPVPDFRTMKRFPEDLPAELQKAQIMRLATPDGKPNWI